MVTRLRKLLKGYADQEMSYVFTSCENTMERTPLAKSNFSRTSCNVVALRSSGGSLTTVVNPTRALLETRSA